MEMCPLLFRLWPSGSDRKSKFLTNGKSLSYGFRYWTFIFSDALQFMMCVSRPMANVSSDLEFSFPLVLA
jgi:hypothetical protein